MKPSLVSLRKEFLRFLSDLRSFESNLCKNSAATRQNQRNYSFGMVLAFGVPTKNLILFFFWPIHKKGPNSLVRAQKSAVKTFDYS